VKQLPMLRPASVVAVLSMASLILAIALVSSSAAQYEKRFNCGGPAFVTGDGESFQADTAYGPGGSGYVGGVAGSDGRAYTIQSLYRKVLLSLTRDGDLFHYYFTVEPGVYRLVLDFCENEFYNPGRRTADIYAEDVLLIPFFHIQDHVRERTDLRIVHTVEVVDGVLEVDFIGQPAAALAAISVLEVSVPGAPPPPPTDLAAIDGYGMAILSWQEPDLTVVQSHRVYRAATVAGPYVLVDDQLDFADYFYDLTAPVDRTYWYRVTATDGFGQESAPAGPVACTPLAASASSLPVFHFTADPADLVAINESVMADVLIPALFRENDDPGRDVEIRYRGGSTRRAPKRSWRIEFPAEDPYAERRNVNVNAEWTGSLVIQARLAWTMMDSLDLLHSRARMVHLQLNDEYLGVHADIENPDEDFFATRGISPVGNLYKCYQPLGIPDNWDTAYAPRTNEDGPHEDIVEFVTFLNETDDWAFPEGLDDRLNVHRFNEYYAAQMILANWDIITKNFYLYNNPETGKWEILPWDLDAAFMLITHDLSFWLGTNVLYTRYMDVAQFRLRWVAHTRALMAGPWQATNWQDYFAAVHDSTLDDGIRDVWKNRSHHNDLFINGGITLGNRLTDRINYLDTALGAFAAEVDWPTINELASAGDPDYLDEAGQADPWLEILNIGPESVSLGGYHLAPAEDAPTPWALPDVTLAAGERLIVLVDGQPEQGDTHASFSVNDGDAIYLLGAAPHYEPIDRVIREQLVPGYSSSRHPDGWVQWGVAPATPAASNGDHLPAELPPLLINEFLASNDTTLADEFGEFDDWVEILNAGDQALNLAGLHLSDDVAAPARWTFPEVTLAAGEYLLVWCDDDPEQGPLHTNFKLNASGETILLSTATADGLRPIDQIDFGEQSTDVSYGRYPDGSETWDYFVMPTPGAANIMVVAVPEAPATLPAGFYYEGSHPNPFNAATTLVFSLPTDGTVSLRIYDLAGRLVRNLDTGRLTAGRHEMTWDGRDDAGRTAASGAYLLRLGWTDRVVHGRLLLAK